MEPLLINNEYVHGHPLWLLCPSTLQQVSFRDYPNKAYFKSLSEVDVLDLDTYEKHQKKHATECTGDAVMGIALKKVGDKLMEQYLLIVELRMGYTNGDNLDLDEIRKKVEHSKTLLNSKKIFRIYPDYIFVFTDAEAPQASNKIRRKANEMGRMTNYKVLSVSNFQNALLDPSELPYQAKHSSANVIRSFSVAYTPSGQLNFDHFKKAFGYWLGELRRCDIKFDLPEKEHLHNILKGEITKAKRLIANPNSDVFIELEILEEDLI